MFKTIWNRLQMRKSGLKSSPLRERLYDVQAGGQTRAVVHSRFNLSWLADLGIAPKVIVELGSFDGGDSHRFKIHFPQARVISVEADPDRISEVRATLADIDVEIQQFAACDTNAPVDWFSSQVGGETHAQGSMYRHTDEYKTRFPQVSQAADPIQVDGKRFDTFCSDSDLTEIDFLHMDIEGAEISVLRSLGDIRPRLIYMEWREQGFIGNETPAQAAQLMTDLGYVLMADLGEDRLYLHKI